MSATHPTMDEAMLHKPDGYGWRSMDCAPRRVDDADGFDIREHVLARTEHGEEIAVLWSIPSEEGPNGWRRVERPEEPIKGRLVAWRPIPEYGEPDDRTIARSLAHDAGMQAEKAERMARFLPQEAEKAERLRAEQRRQLEIANRRR